MIHDVRVAGFDSDDTTAYIYRCVECGAMSTEPFSDGLCEPINDETGTGDDKHRC